MVYEKKCEEPLIILEIYYTLTDKCHYNYSLHCKSSKCSRAGSLLNLNQYSPHFLVLSKDYPNSNLNPNPKVGKQDLTLV